MTKKFNWTKPVTPEKVDTAWPKTDMNKTKVRDKVKTAKWADRNPIDLPEVRAKLKKLAKES